VVPFFLAVYDFILLQVQFLVSQFYFLIYLYLQLLLDKELVVMDYHYKYHPTCLLGYW